MVKKSLQLILNVFHKYKQFKRFISAINSLLNFKYDMIYSFKHEITMGLVKK